MFCDQSGSNRDQRVYMCKQASKGGNGTEGHVGLIRAALRPRVDYVGQCGDTIES